MRLDTDRLPGRLVWHPLSAVHRRLTPGLLRDAAQVIDRIVGAAGASGTR